MIRHELRQKMPQNHNALLKPGIAAGKKTCKKIEEKIKFVCRYSLVRLSHFTKEKRNEPKNVYVYECMLAYYVIEIICEMHLQFLAFWAFSDFNYVPFSLVGRCLFVFVSFETFSFLIFWCYFFEVFVLFFWF